MRLVFTQSHAFPGGRVTLEDDGAPGAECVVEFADGVVVLGEYERSGRDMILRVPAYRTARGTQIEAKSWRIVQQGDGSWRSRPAPEQAGGTPM